MKNKTKIWLIVMVVVAVLALGGISFAWFNYRGETNSQEFIAGDIYLTMEEGVNQLSINNVFPQTSEEARAATNNTIVFTLNGRNTADKDVYYEIKLEHGADKESPYIRFNDNDILFDLIELDENGNEVKYLLSNMSFDDWQNKRIWAEKVEKNTTTPITKKYKLRAWVSEDVLISDTEPNATYPESGANAYKNHYASIKVSVFGDFQEKEVNYGFTKVLKAIDAKKNAETDACNPIWTDDTDGTIYFSGNNTCVNMNYVWYSGKLWRITAIYPDGTMKMITENAMTTIAYNSEGNVDFSNSYVYNWLNEEFYNTLYNTQNIINTKKKWNATQMSSYTAKPAETTMVSSNVGLLNTYEFYNSYRNLGNTSNGIKNGYLIDNNDLYFWLLNSYSSSYLWSVKGSTGAVYTQGNNDENYPTKVFQVRPSIYLSANVELVGSGTISDPYTITNDKEVGNINDPINTRISGEFVKLKNGADEQLFRIVGVEDNKTKVVAMNAADSGAKKPFATSTAGITWGSGTTTGSGTWYTYLNSTYYPNLVSTYGDLFDSATYYLGKSGYDYKLSVCANTTSGNTTVCDKTSQVGSFNIGLLRYGELLAAQDKENIIQMWLINRSVDKSSWKYIWNIYIQGYSSADGSANNPTSTRNGARPTVHLKESVKILSGSGTRSDPYIVGL